MNAAEEDDSEKEPIDLMARRSLESSFSRADENVYWISVNGGENIGSCWCIIFVKFGRERKEADKIVVMRKR